MAFKLTSPAFPDGGPVPVQFTCDGSDAPPPLTVSDPPPATRSFALIVDDPDAPKGTFVHWLAYDIPVPANEAELSADRGTTLRNGFGRQGYGGPCPPPGDDPHRYHFTLYAVDVERLEVTSDNRKDLEQALSGHTLATTRLTGRYARAR